MALLQSLVGVNQDHVRMIAGMPSTHLCVICAARSLPAQPGSCQLDGVTRTLLARSCRDARQIPDGGRGF
jgi:hypothetical protein